MGSQQRVAAVREELGVVLVLALNSQVAAVIVVIRLKVVSSPPGGRRGAGVHCTSRYNRKSRESDDQGAEHGS